MTDDRLAGHIPDTIMEEEQNNGNHSTDTNSTSSSSSSSSLKTTILPPQQNNGRNNSLLPDFINTSNCGSNASSPARSVKSFHASVPNLRADNSALTNTNINNANDKPPLHPTPPKKVGRSCSQGDVQLRKNFGSADLLSRAFLGGSSNSTNNTNIINKRNSIADIPRHGSVENVLNVEKRRQKTPTIVNRIHNLEVREILLHRTIGR